MKNYIFPLCILLFAFESCIQAWDVDQLSEQPRVFFVHKFLSPEECDYLIAYASPHMSPSTTVNESTGENEVNTARTSTSMFFPEYSEDKVIQKIENRIAQLSGIPTANTENLQVAHYVTGAQFFAHYDYFNPNSPGGKILCKRGGQRKASLIIYLNAPKAGGETVFPRIKLSIVPVKGDAVFFYNIDPSGKEDPLTLHAGAEVLAGEKWIVNCWFREGKFRSVPYQVP